MKIVYSICRWSLAIISSPILILGWIANKYIENKLPLTYKQGGEIPGINLNLIEKLLILPVVYPSVIICGICEMLAAKEQNES